jgi:hypothetical protein
MSFTDLVELDKFTIEIIWLFIHQIICFIGRRNENII